jgi:hypothetical protein
MTSNLDTFILQNQIVKGLPDIPNKENKFRVILDNIKLQLLPESFGYGFPLLSELILSNNLLQTIPNSIGNIISLKILDLHNNKLNSLPESIGNLVNLISLDLDDNSLITLPESLVNLSKLKTLGLTNNKVIKLPNQMTKLTSLKNLFVNDNTKLTELPELNYANLDIIEFENTGIKVYPSSFQNYKGYNKALHPILQAKDFPFMYPYKPIENKNRNKTDLVNNMNEPVIANRILDDEEKNEEFIKGMNRLDPNAIRNIAEFWGNETKGGKTKKLKIQKSKLRKRSRKHKRSKKYRKSRR